MGPPESPALIASSNIDDASLPVILCLHGGGSSANIFRFQCRRLEALLRSRFRFVYPNGPLLSKPGHGILPVFESVTPYYRWVTDVYGATPDKQEPPQKEVDEINRIIEETIDKVGGPEQIVGVMGFSQGARLASGVICREYERRRTGDQTSWPKLGFGTVIGGPYPPISLTKQDGDVADCQGMKAFPIVHAWGKDDHVKAGCQKLAKACDSPNMFVYEFEGEHHLPLTDPEARELADLIEEAHFTNVTIP